MQTFSRANMTHASALSPLANPEQGSAAGWLTLGMDEVRSNSSVDQSDGSVSLGERFFSPSVRCI